MTPCFSFPLNSLKRRKYVSISDNIFDSSDVARQDKLKKIDSFIKALINENDKYTYTLEENDIKKEVGVNRNTRKKLSEQKDLKQQLK